MKLLLRIFFCVSIFLFIPIFFVSCKTKGSTYTEGLEYKLSSNGQYYILTSIGMAQEDTINIPSKFNGLDVKVIGESAFENYSFIKKIIMPNSIISIENSAFKNCYSLTKVVLSKNLQIISDYAFYNCENLQNIELPNSIEEIGQSSFYNCEKITSIKIGSIVKKIGTKAFYNCINLTNIYFNAEDCQNFGPGSYIFYNAGKGVLNGITVYVGNTVKSIPGYIFCNNFISENSPNITNLIFEQKSICSYIGYYSFAYCNSITSITIPATIKTIDSCAFSHCENLKNVKFENVNDWMGTTKGSNIQTVTINSEDITDLETAATYLKTTYSSYCWIIKNT